MKIIVLRSNNPFYENSASANRWRTLIEGLTKHGAVIQLIVVGGYWTKREHDDFILSRNQVIKTYYPVCRPMSLKLLRVFYHIISPLINLTIKLKLKEILNTFQPDIVWTCRGKREMEVLYSFLKEDKSFLSMIELSEFDDYDSKSKDCQKMFFFRKYLVKKLDIFNIITVRLIEHYKKLSGGKAYYIHTPMTVDLSRFNCPSSKYLQTPYLAYCGGLTNRKDGIDILIKAFAKISDKIPHVLYLIGSKTTDYPEQRNIIESCHLQNRVIFLGTKQRDEIPPILKGASALCLARPDSRQAQGGFPTKLGEYLATGNPVCVTKVGEIPDYLKDRESAFLAEAGDVDSFADVLLTACTDFELAHTVGLNGRKVAEENFDMDLKMNQLYNKLKTII